MLFFIEVKGRTRVIQSALRPLPGRGEKIVPRKSNKRASVKLVLRNDIHPRLEECGTWGLGFSIRAQKAKCGPDVPQMFGMIIVIVDTCFFGFWNGLFILR